MFKERLPKLLLLRDKISKATQIICVFAIVLMFLVTFGPVVNKYFSEVGFPDEGFTYNDWYIEPGDRVVRENEVLKISVVPKVI